MTDSTLSVGVDSSGVRSASGDLERFVQKGNDAAKTTREIEKASREANRDAEKLGQSIGAAFAASIVAVGGAVAGLDRLIKSIGDYQDLADETGGSAVGFASLQTAADVAGVSINSIAEASVRLTTSLSKTDDESKTVGKALAAIGISVKDFKELDPAQQYRAVAVALSGYADGAQKTAVAIALYGRAGAEQLKVLKEVGSETEAYNLLSAKQLALADEYADSSSRASSKIRQLGEAAAIEAAPAILDLKKALAEAIGDLLGLDKASGKLVSNGAVKEFAETAVDALAGLFDQLVAIGKLFDVTGKFIGATAAATRAAVTGNREELAAIRADFDADLKRITTFTTLAQRIQDQRGKSALANAAGIGSIEDPKNQKIDTSGFVAEPKGNVDGSAKAQLAADLADIKSGLQEQINAYKNAQSILDALRAADLVDERYYYDAKRKFIDDTASAQVKALQDENARIAEQKASGKDLIENRKKIAENELKIASIQADASAKTTVLGVQQVAALNKVSAAFIEAKASADAYLATLSLQAERNIAAVGQGDKERQRLADLNSIEDSYAQKRDKLESDRRLGAFKDDADGYQRQLALLERTKAAEIEIYSSTSAAIDSEQSDFRNGAKRALQNYLDDATNLAKQTDTLFTNVLGGLEDVLVDFVKTGKLNFKSLADSIISDLARIAIRRQLSGLVGSILGSFSNSMSTNNTGTSLPTAGGRAGGGPVSKGSLYQVNENGPELLTVGGRDYLMMGAQGGLVTPNGGRVTGAPNVTVNVIGGAQPEKVQSRQDGSGNLSIDLLYDQFERRLNERTAAGYGVAPGVQRRLGGTGAVNLGR